jgi:uncharacterized membrane protein
VALGLLVLSWALTIGLYDRVPDPVPTHWGLSGKADGFTPKPWGAFLSPALLTLVWAILSFGPRRATDPRTGTPLRDLSAYQAGVLALIFAVSSLHLWLLFDGARVHPLGVLMGALLVPLGLVLPRLPRNGVMGIRTPWSMRSDDAWRATHRLAGPVMVIGGLALLACGLLGARGEVQLALLALTLAVPTIASWYFARRDNQP